MTQVMRKNDLPGGRQIRLCTPEFSVSGTFGGGTCRSCHQPTEDEAIAFAAIYDKNGDVELPGPWMHLKCATQRYELLLNVDMLQHNVKIHTGTQKEFLAFLQSHQGEAVVVDFEHVRGREVRYCWSYLNGASLQNVVVANTGAKA